MRVPVYVLNLRGQPLMPTTPCKARKLVKSNQAQVIRRLPFTIQLGYATGEAKPKIKLGIDAGYSVIGFSATTEKQEVIAGEVELRQDVSRNLTQRRQYRRTRRNRLWYRKPRFNNRVATQKPGWLPPSIQHKLDTPKRVITEFQNLLPLTSIHIEVAAFEAHQLKKPEISGVEYHQGELQGYEIREYLLEKWQRKCAYCGKTGIPLEIEPIVPKSRGGSNRVAHLTLACRRCNRKKGDQTATEFGFPEIAKKAAASLKAAPFMNLVRTHLVEELGCGKTYGYITKHDRIKLGLAKSHVNDAYVIAGGTTQPRCRSFLVKQVRRNNRSIQTNRKGFKPSIRRQRYPLHPQDLVRYEGELYVVKGVFNYGKWVRLGEFTSGEKTQPLNQSIKNVNLVKYGKGLHFSYLTESTD